MALVSPGVEVNVIDESFYTPAAAGTVPMIFVATASNKTKSSGTGTAAGTIKANAGKPYLITSQRELGETFGDPLFYSDNNGNMIHGGELNEYGLTNCLFSIRRFKSCICCSCRFRHIRTYCKCNSTRRRTS